MGCRAPDRTIDTEPFWDGCREGRFLVPQCATHAAAADGRPGRCARTAEQPRRPGSPSDGQGRCTAGSSSTHPVDEVLVDQVPYVVGLIDLPEGVRVVGNVVGGEPGDLSAGEPVELFFEDAEDGMRLPSFRRVDHREGETR